MSDSFAIQWPSVADLDLTFRPATYFWPLPIETHLLARIKGAERKALARSLAAARRLADLPPELAQSRLSHDDRHAQGAIHPSLMGGEYLPDLADHEVEIARITIASVTQDVTSVYARRGRRRIYYRVVDDYGGETLQAPSRRTSLRPLMLGELEAFFTVAWPLLRVLEANFGDNGDNLQRVLGFVVSIDSEFYPDLDRLYRRRIVDWFTQRAAAEAQDMGATP